MYPDSKIHGADNGPIWGRQDPGGPYVGLMNFAFWVNDYCSKLSHNRPLLTINHDIDTQQPPQKYCKY